MFKCSECGCEFDIKPDFCDCGNDVFVEITDAQPLVQQQRKPEKKHKTFEEQYPELSRNLEKLDPISVIIFIICIILSVLSFVFIKPSEKAPGDTNTKIAAEKPKREVKDINTFWNDTPPKAEETNTEITIQDLPDNTETVKPVPTPVVKPSQPTIKKTTQTAPKNQVKTAQKNQPKANQNTQKKTATQPKKTTPTQQPAQKPANNTQNQTPTKPKVTTYPPQPSVTIVTDSSSSGTKNTQTVNTQEWENYKARLRNYIGNKIDYTQIYGDGSCVVTFKISSSGKLTERKFTTLSSNTTLNDAVYAAVNSVSSYNPPPSAYNGQTLKFTVKYYNGRYSVTLK